MLGSSHASDGGGKQPYADTSHTPTVLHFQYSIQSNTWVSFYYKIVFMLEDFAQL